MKTGSNRFCHFQSTRGCVTVMSSLTKLHLQVGQLDSVWLRNELGPQGSQVKLSLWLRPLVSGQRAEVVFVCPHGHHRACGWLFLGLLSTDKEAAASLLTSDRLCPALCEIMSFCCNFLPQFPTFCMCKLRNFKIYIFFFWDVLLLFLHLIRALHSFFVFS